MSTENKKPENPNAFPYVIPGDKEKGWDAEILEGMTLRDYFSAKAMQGCCVCDGPEFPSPTVIAKWSYAVADAMLKERENV